MLVPKGMTTQAEPRKRRRGRPRLGDKRLQIVVPQAAYDALVKIEEETEVYRTQTAARIVSDHLLGSGVTSRARSGRAIEKQSFNGTIAP